MAGLMLVRQTAARHRTQDRMPEPMQGLMVAQTLARIPARTRSFPEWPSESMPPYEKRSAVGHSGGSAAKPGGRSQVIVVGKPMLVADMLEGGP